MTHPVDDLRLDALDLEAETRAGLRALGLGTVGALQGASALDLSALGPSALEEVRRVLHFLGRSLAGESEIAPPEDPSFEVIARFMRDPLGNLGAPLYALDLCHKTRVWLAERGFRTVRQFRGALREDVQAIPGARPELVDDLWERLRFFGLAGEENGAVE